MPIHHNKDGTWQWGQAGKRYRSRKDAIRQMRAIFANGYKELQDKKASFLGASRASCFLAAIAPVGSYGMAKTAANLQGVPVRHTIRKGDRVTGSIWNTYGKKHGYKNPILFQKAVQLANKGVNFNKLSIGKALNIPKFTGTRLPLYYPISWTALLNRAAANRARAKFFRNKTFNVSDYTSRNYLIKKLVPQDKNWFSSLLKYPTFALDKIGYLKIPQIALRNAIRIKLTRDNKFAYNNTAAGQWQLLPGAVNHLRKNKLLSLGFKVDDLYEDTPQANFSGYDYFRLINKDNPLPWVGYAKYRMGPYHYSNLKKKPYFNSKKYPDERTFYWRYGNLYLTGDRAKENYGADVRDFYGIHTNLLKKGFDTWMPVSKRQ